ncbi:MAG TPA: DegT/DnrJ/EryC1/StrS family aminotransferase [Burkholderiales bacterium]|nr:DegT/DnrJ/EryC1/StrS family aminotransferase [Burkholderiales bacterium]
MIPRKRIDISTRDLARGLAFCCAAGDGAREQVQIESTWDHRNNLACLSVRSGLDAVLATLALPLGSEVLMSAVNIADMACIIQAHGLVAIPVDMDMRRLEVPLMHLTRAATPRTRAVLIAHLFGSRMPMRDIVEFCNKNKYLLIEDAAQAYTGDEWRGDAQADVSLFSFGPVKAATALGGAVLSFRDAALCARVRGHMARWPVQSRGAYALRLAKYTALAPFAHRWVFGALAVLCRWCGTTHEVIVSGAARGFTGGHFFQRIRQRPAAPLLRLMHVRIAQGVQASAVRRAQNSRQLQVLLGNSCVGEAAVAHTHWIFPITHSDPDGLLRRLAARGFDATRHASSIDVVAPPPGAAQAAEAANTFAQLVYLPAHEGVSAHEIERMAAAVAAFVPRVRSAARPSPA